MFQIFSRWLTRQVYKTLAKPILFRQAPDTVHEQMIRCGRWLQKTPLGTVVQLLWPYQNPSVLTQQIGDTTFRNPVGLSAGLDKNARIVPLCQQIGFGFTTVGSISAQPCSGNPRPWFHRLPKSQSLVVNAGLPNDGVDNIATHLATVTPLLSSTFPVIASIAKTNSPASVSEKDAINDYCASAQRLAATEGIQVLELNISCPNAYGGESFATPPKLRRLLTALRDADITTPLWVKMPINLPWEEFRQLLDVICSYSVQAVTIGNLNKNRGELPSGELPSEVKGNLSGKPTEALSNALIAQTYLHYGDRLAIIGVGGIFSAEDAYRKIRLGASLVELITGLIYQGPQLIGHINHGLATLLRRDGLGTIGDAVGLDAHTIVKQ